MIGTQPLLRARGIGKKFGHPAEVEIFADLDLEIYPGEKIAIVGASGEGKSTLLHILGTLDSYSSGSLEWKGVPLLPSDAPRFRNQSIGFVFQAFQLLEEWTALENAMMPARIGRQKGGRSSAARERASELLHVVGLGHRLHFPVKLLSGGERQRVAIARAMCNEPDLILADEPSGNLDHKSSQAIQELLLTTVADRAKTLVLVTHDKELAGRCDRSLLLRNGKLISL
jgi:lipoprotein-releasing system ATP-binding protein